MIKLSVRWGPVYHLPNDIVHADYILWLIAGVVDDGGPRLKPHPVTVLAQKPVVLAHRCSLYYHCNTEMNKNVNQGSYRQVCV